MIPLGEVASRRGMVATVDHVATSAGLHTLQAGGTAVDAAIAASAVLAVTSQHFCGMGGDLFAVVHHGEPVPAALNATGRAGSGASASELRAEGHARMPFRDDIRTVTVPGCVDGWLALHGRFGRLPFGDVVAPAIATAEHGFAPSPTLRALRPALAACPGGRDFAGDGPIIARPRLAALLREIAHDGRGAFYGGAFGKGLIDLGRGLYDEADLARDQADWVPALGRVALDHQLWTIPPNSSGYAALLGAAIVDRLDCPSDPDDPAWAHVIVEASRAAAHDRPSILHQDADGPALVSDSAADERAGAISSAVAADWGVERWEPGGTMSLSVVDADRMAVTLIQSNAAAWGSGIVEPTTGVFLHNRGLGFSLREGHPAEFAPGRRPPHTLSPMIVTRPDRSVALALGTRGGDSQPHILLQLLVRLLAHGESAGAAMAAPRLILGSRDGGSDFDTWTGATGTTVRVEGHAPPAWMDGLRARGHDVTPKRAFNHSSGYANLVAVGADDVLTGAADPRPGSGAAAGY